MLLSGLPSAEEKLQIQSRISDLKRFIDDLDKSLASIPPIKDTTLVSEAIEKLAGLFMKAESNPTMGPLLGITPAGQRKLRRSEPLTEVQVSAARNQIQELNSLTIDEIRSRLNGENYSLADMRAIARALGMRPPQKLSREQFAHQIATKIANSRGCERLGEGS